MADTAADFDVAGRIKYAVQRLSSESKGLSPGTWGGDEGERGLVAVVNGAVQDVLDALFFCRTNHLVIGAEHKLESLGIRSPSTEQVHGHIAADERVDKEFLGLSKIVAKWQNARKSDIQYARIEKLELAQNEEAAIRRCVKDVVEAYANMRLLGSAEDKTKEMNNAAIDVLMRLEQLPFSREEAEALVVAACQITEISLYESASNRLKPPPSVGYVVHAGPDSPAISKQREP